MSIISYEELDTHYRELDGELDVLRENYKIVVKSHMELQCRNEKLRTRNSRLIKIVSDIRESLNGKR